MEKRGGGGNDVGCGFLTIIIIEPYLHISWHAIPASLCIFFFFSICDLLMLYQPKFNMCTLLLCEQFLLQVLEYFQC